jgi:sugar-phosphatase
MRREEVLLTHGVPARQILARMLDPDEVDAELAVIERIEIDDCAGVVALSGATQALQVLAGRCAIVTSCTWELFLARSAAARLPVPAVVVTASDVRIGKPDPAPYLMAARRLGVDPAQCLVIEDAPAGLIAARAAGCATLAVTTTHDAGALAADVVVTGLNDVSFLIVDDRVIVRRTQQ